MPRIGSFWLALRHLAHYRQIDRREQENLIRCIRRSVLPTIDPLFALHEHHQARLVRSRGAGTRLRPSVQPQPINRGRGIAFAKPHDRQFSLPGRFARLPLRAESMRGPYSSSRSSAFTPSIQLSANFRGHVHKNPCIDRIRQEIGRIGIPLELRGRLVFGLEVLAGESPAQTRPTVLQAPTTCAIRFKIVPR